jgi:hypothetical protein
MQNFIHGRPQRLSTLLKVVHFMSIAAAQNPGMVSYTAKHLARACAMDGGEGDCWYGEGLTTRFRLAIYASTKVFSGQHEDSSPMWGQTFL